MEGSTLALLPPEVRNRIYDFALIRAGQVRIKYPPPTWKNDNYNQPPLTRVCRQMREECLLMFYARNDFVMQIDVHGDWSKHSAKTVEQLKMLVGWLRRTSRQHHHLIGTIRLELYTKYDEPVHPGPWHAGVSWRLNFRPWEELMDVLRRHGYARKDISLCLFGEVRHDHRQWLATLFPDGGDAGGIEVDSRASRRHADPARGELEVEGFFAGLPRSRSRGVAKGH